MIRPICGAILLAVLQMTGCAPTLPNNTPIQEARWLAQNWTADERYWYHHASQGTSTLPVPYDWFIALEQPTLSIFGAPGLISDSDYLRRFGFIPSPKSRAKEAVDPVAYGYAVDEGGRTYGSVASYDETAFYGNPDGLPVGFARTETRDLNTGEKHRDGIGFTCAACHTGHLEYQGVSLRIDGAPAMTNLGKFREVVGLALAYTRYVPGRFDRFAERVLGKEHSKQEKESLFEALKTLIADGKAFQALTKDVAEGDVEEGFARLDALNRIANQVFFTNLLEAKEEGFDATANLESNNAPVAYPHIWDASWFKWVQYDASIMQPMVRNAGEALGVAARVNMHQPGESLYRSDVEVQEIYDMEQLLAGDNPFSAETGFKGLMAPDWPEDLLGEIDPERQKRGQALYEKFCQGCHLPSVDDPSGAFWSHKRWTDPNEANERYLDLKAIPVTKIGTDPAQADVLASRMVKVPTFLDIKRSDIGRESGEDIVTEMDFARALAVVVEKTTSRWYDDNGVAPADRQRMNGNRPNKVRPTASYKARPLDGIWATAPFLHNGSVPNLWALLSPVEERPAKFCLGSRQYDPKHVGYSTECIAGAFELDTDLAGNRNVGHEFTNATGRGGKFGRELTDQERWDLIEYLKSL